MRNIAYGGRLPPDGDIERLCEALVNAAADWWARRRANDDVTRGWNPQLGETHPGEPRPEGQPNAISGLAPAAQYAGDPEMGT